MLIRNFFYCAAASSFHCCCSLRSDRLLPRPHPRPSACKSSNRPLASYRSNSELEQEVAGLKKRTTWAPVLGPDGKAKTEVTSDGKKYLI